jgi:predicted negative regulator of RcsB-dependent stress response
MKKQVRKLATLSLIAGSMMMFSCGDSKKENTEEKVESHENMDHEMHEAEVKTTEAEVEFKEEKVGEIFTKYLSLKDALVGTDAEAAKEAAQELKSTLGDDHSEIASIAGEIAAAKEVNAQREKFSALTAKMESVLDGAVASGKIYKQFCPMAFEGKGDYWYSNSEEIRNPYFGDKMLKCGRVEKTIM